MGTSITGQTFANGDVVAGQKFYAANYLALIAQMQALNDELVAECVSLAGAQTITGAKTFTGITTLKDGSVMASSAAPSADAQIANKKYIDDQIAINHPTYSGGESYTDGSGLITKMGTAAISANSSATVTFGTAFPNAIVAAVATYRRNADHASSGGFFWIKSRSKTALIVFTSEDFSGSFDWIAKGR